MNKDTTSTRQSWADISILKTGTPDNAFAIALANGFSVTDTIPEGTQFVIPSDLVTSSPEVVQYFTARELVPATDLTVTNNDLLEDDLGIGLMEIGSTFKVR